MRNLPSAVSAVTTGHDAEAVVLDFVQPVDSEGGRGSRTPGVGRCSRTTAYSYDDAG